MSEVNKNSLEKILPQLKCHFTWNLLKKDGILRDLEDRVCNQIEFVNAEFKATMYNFLAYIKHLNGHNEAALECLQQAEELVQREHSDQAEIRRLVTWGNYAWVYYHLGRLTDAQIYVDKVKQVCGKFSNPYSMECPELDCEEGWTLLKCGGKHNERAKVCFEKALEEKPNNPEFSSGLAIATYRLDSKPQKPFSVDDLKQALELNPDDQYVKVLLALKLQKMNEEAEGERLVLEAVENTPCPADVLCNAATFYKNKGDLDKAIELFLRASKSIPNNGYLYHQIACCYRAKVKQIQSARESEAGKNGEKIEELKKHAIDYVIKAIEKGVDPLYAYSDVTDLLEREDCFQTAFSKELPNTGRLQPHQHYCDFEGHHGKSEDTSVQRDLEGVPTSTKPAEKGEMKCPPQNIAGNQLPQNAPNSWYLQGLIHKLNGELLQAAECYEKELGHLLRNSPTGIGSFFLPSPELEQGSEEAGRGPHSPILRAPPTLS
ncbi:interferon-induced protein with tetratricopeptide repeats 3 isoform X2 [Panthera tigris]|uniref:interferon-induced protein with tetratricopeptide repeats 3 isoform X1 n=1 Tax=Panthera tigris TaxID=9694 RepID=UPI001C6F9B94|nr:interferon-induced protein with tetratricopeptide repeats 3 isoform X1 [Panthera tigris]XP_042815740.1 interferon-induced protein with tetratricopeptide repeats 3 isoform X2 [Panthera tigris]